MIYVLLFVSVGFAALYFGARGFFGQVDFADARSEELRVLSLKNSALRWLGHMRGGYDGYRDFLKYMREDLAKAGLTLRDIGTDDTELEQLRILALVVSAKRWIRYITDGSGASLSREFLRHDVNAGPLTTSMLGINQELFDRLVRV